MENGKFTMFWPGGNKFYGKWKNNHVLAKWGQFDRKWENYKVLDGGYFIYQTINSFLLASYCKEVNYSMITAQQPSSVMDYCPFNLTLLYLLHKARAHCSSWGRLMGPLGTLYGALLYANSEYSSHSTG